MYLQVKQRFRLKTSFEIGAEVSPGVISVFDLTTASVYCKLNTERRVFRSKNTTTVEKAEWFILPIHFPVFGIHYYKGHDKIFKDPVNGPNAEYVWIDKEKGLVKLSAAPSQTYKISIPPTFYDDGVYYIIGDTVTLKQAMTLNEQDVSRILTSMKGKTYLKDTITGEALYYIYKGNSFTKILTKMPEKVLERGSQEAAQVMLKIHGCDVELPIKLKYLEKC